MDEKTLTVLINTLGRIEVRGKENMGMILGCIKLCEDALAKMKAEKERE